MRLAVLLFCSALTFGQNTSSPPETKSQAPGNSPDQKSHNHDSRSETYAAFGLSDKQGAPYLKQVLPKVYERWYLLTPESGRIRTGRLTVAFEIARDGSVENMRLVGSSGDAALDCAAWRSIADLSPFSPLPDGLTGPYLPVSIPFYDSRKLRDLPPLNVSKPDGRVSISLPRDLRVPVGGSEVVTAIVTGTNEQGVEWRITGPGCSASTLGKMVGDLYIAPRALPNPPVVTLTASSKADPTAKASITVYMHSAAKTPSKP